MKTRILLIIIFLFFAHSTFSQITFQKTYGGAQEDYFNFVQQTADGGYIMVGATMSFGAGGLDVYLVKIDSTGDILWTKTFGGPYSDFGYCVQQTTDSGYIILGNTDGDGSGGTSGAYLIKTNSYGDSLWTKIYKPISYGGSGWSVKQTFDSGYILNCNRIASLIKTNALGDTLWTKSYGIASALSEVQQTADSGYIITGTGNDGDLLYYFYLVKTDFNGNVVWKKAYKKISFNEQFLGYSGQQTPDGGYIAVGYKNDTLPDVADVYLIKTNSIGDTLWTKAYGGDSADEGWSIHLTADSGYIIAGFTQSFGAGGHDAYLIKTDLMGSILFTKSFGGLNSDGSNSVQQTIDGGYILAGSTNSFGAGGNDAYLIKTDASGNSGCYDNSPSTIVSSAHITSSLPVDTFLSNPIFINSYNALASSGGIISTLCISTSIHENSQVDEVTIYPNPAINNFSINLNEEVLIANIEIHNILGEKKYSAKLNSKLTSINCNEFPSGIYFITIGIVGNFITKKLIINK